MPITNEQVQATLDVLLAYIEQQPMEHVYKDEEESTATNEVRNWCYQLLHKANACGYGGCSLCLS